MEEVSQIIREIAENNISQAQKKLLMHKLENYLPEKIAVAIYGLRFCACPQYKESKLYYQEVIPLLIQYLPICKETILCCLQRLSTASLNNLASQHPLRSQEELFYQKLFGKCNLPCPEFANEIYGIIVDPDNNKACAVHVILEQSEIVSADGINMELSWYQPDISAISSTAKNFMSPQAYSCEIMIYPIWEDCLKKREITTDKIFGRSLEMAILAVFIDRYYQCPPRLPIAFTGCVEYDFIQKVSYFREKITVLQQYQFLHRLFASQDNRHELSIEPSEESTKFIWCKQLSDVCSSLQKNPLDGLFSLKELETIADDPLSLLQEMKNLPEINKKSIASLLIQDRKHYLQKARIAAKYRPVEVPANTTLQKVGLYIATSFIHQKEFFPIVLIHKNNSIEWPIEQKIIEHSSQYTSIIWIIIDIDNSFDFSQFSAQSHSICHIYHVSSPLNAEQIEPWRTIASLEHHIAKTYISFDQSDSLVENNSEIYQNNTQCSSNLLFQNFVTFLSSNDEQKLHEVHKFILYHYFHNKYIPITLQIDMIPQRILKKGVIQWLDNLLQQDWKAILTKNINSVFVCNIYKIESSLQNIIIEELIFFQARYSHIKIIFIGDENMHAQINTASDNKTILTLEKISQANLQTIEKLLTPQEIIGLVDDCLKNYLKPKDIKIALQKLNLNPQEIIDSSTILSYYIDIITELNAQGKLHISLEILSSERPRLSQKWLPVIKTNDFLQAKELIEMAEDFLAQSIGEEHINKTLYKMNMYPQFTLNGLDASDYYREIITTLNSQGKLFLLLQQLAHPRLQKWYHILRSHHL